MDSPSLHSPWDARSPRWTCPARRLTNYDVDSARILSFAAIHDSDGTLRDVGNDYSLLMFVSVLHHIPDYIPYLNDACKRITKGGTLLTLQDPALYSRHSAAHHAEQAAYFIWRLGQGNLTQGIQTRLRRSRGILDETEPRDMVEYHVIRDGVDEEKILSFAKTAFSEVSLIQYWSSQLGLAQRLGERVGLQDSFGIIANEYKPDLPAVESGAPRIAGPGYATADVTFAVGSLYCCQRPGR